MRIGLRVFGAVLLVGCHHDATPQPTPSSASSSAAPIASSPPPAVASTTAEREATDDAGGDGGRVAPSGGNWLRCYANFQPRTKPSLDVMRLGLMCGPSNGMRKVAEASDAEVADGGPGREHHFSAEAGDCFRIFAVGDPGIVDLDLEVFDPKGNRIAFDTGDDRWPIVKPDGPFCVFEAGDYRAKIHAQRGAGHYAVEIWRLH